MKRLFPVLVLSPLLFVACSEDSICECIRVSDDLLVKYDSLDGKTPTEEDQKEVKALIAKKKEKCKEFELMSGPEMMKRKESCK